MGLFSKRARPAAVPAVPVDFAEDILDQAGFAATDANVVATRDFFIELLLIKAQEFIGSQSPQQAASFAARHRRTTDPQTILQELGDWDPDVIPYIQDLPARIRALILRPENRVHLADRLPQP
jgi:hypothetical protein